MEVSAISSHVPYLGNYPVKYLHKIENNRHGTNYPCSREARTKKVNTVGKVPNIAIPLIRKKPLMTCLTELIISTIAIS